MGFNYLPKPSTQPTQSFAGMAVEIGSNAGLTPYQAGKDIGSQSAFFDKSVEDIKEQNTFLFNPTNFKIDPYQSKEDIAALQSLMLEDDTEDNSVVIGKFKEATKAFYETDEGIAFAARLDPDGKLDEETLKMKVENTLIQNAVANLEGSGFGYFVGHLTTPEFYGTTVFVIVALVIAFINRNNKHIKNSEHTTKKENVTKNGISFDWWVIFITKIKKQFSQEWIWRLFVVLQVIGVLGVIYLFDTASYTFRYRHSDIFNWYVGILLLSPYLISKSINWINDVKNEKL